MKDKRSFFEKLTGVGRSDDMQEEDEMEKRPSGRASAGETAWFDEEIKRVTDIIKKTLK